MNKTSLYFGEHEKRFHRAFMALKEIEAALTEKSKMSFSEAEAIAHKHGSRLENVISIIDLAPLCGVDEKAKEIVCL